MMLNKIAVYLPSSILGNEDLSRKFPDFPAAKIDKKIGIRNRHIIGPGETTADMAVQAAERVLTGYDRTQIDFLLLCTQSPDYLLPGTSSQIQQRLGLSKRTGAFDYNLGCSGFVYGLAVAKGLLAAGIASHILLITAESYSRYLAEEDKGNRSIFGDAAAAAILEKDGLFSLGEFVLGTDGRGTDNLIVAQGGNFSRAQKASPCQPILFMNGPEVFNFTIEAVPPLFADTLDRNHLKKEDIHHVVFHQANKFMLKHLQMKLGLEDRIFHISMENTGNTVSSSIPIVLSGLMEQDVFSDGENILIAGFGVGYSYGATVLTYHKEKK